MPRRRKIGVPPGSLTSTPDEIWIEPQLDVLQYWQEYFQERQNVKSVEEIKEIYSHEVVTWIRHQGTPTVDLLKFLGEQFAIHQLTLEDISNTEQLVKLEEHDEYLFATIKWINFNSITAKLEFEQINLILKEHLIISLAQNKNNHFNILVERLRGQHPTRLREKDADYLFYLMLDFVVDNYMNVVEDIEAACDLTEVRMGHRLNAKLLQEMHELRNELNHFKRTIHPLRDFPTKICKCEEPLVSESMHIYYRDLLDHIHQVTEDVNILLDSIHALMGLYFSMINLRMNEIIRALTVISTIFLPLTFIVGVYGMNFKYMPELELRYGYFVLWAFLISVGIGAFWFIRRKRLL
jgi:magnesium transporter